MEKKHKGFVALVLHRRRARVGRSRAEPCVCRDAQPPSWTDSLACHLKAICFSVSSPWVAYKQTARPPDRHVSDSFQLPRTPRPADTFLIEEGALCRKFWTYEDALDSSLGHLSAVLAVSLSVLVACVPPDPARPTRRREALAVARGKASRDLVRMFCCPAR